MQLYNESWWKKRPDMCASLENRFQVLNEMCTEYFRVKDEPMGKAFYGMVPQAARRTNVLLVPTDEGRFGFVDEALKFNLREAGWVWNAQFADLDQDGWQDLYVANGMFFENTNDARESNHYFHNAAGKTFVDETSAAGLGMNAESSSYTYADIDNDGDLDIVAVEALGPVWAFVNNQTDNNAVTFELRDSQGNHFGIGSQLIAHLDNGDAQLRELRSSGGFISYNAPVVHFGIGSSKSIDSIDIRWSTGETTSIKGEFTPGRRYVISRQ
jgi:hypothetical protein